MRWVVASAPLPASMSKKVTVRLPSTSATLQSTSPAPSCSSWLSSLWLCSTSLRSMISMLTSTVAATQVSLRLFASPLPALS